MRAEMLLFMASRAQLVDEVIRPALVAGRVVICDRFSLANIVYQGHAGGLGVAEVDRIGPLGHRRPAARPDPHPGRATRDSAGPRRAGT